jgi:tungstate transport system substrate-binding protein
MMTAPHRLGALGLALVSPAAPVRRVALASLRLVAPIALAALGALAGPAAVTAPAHAQSTVVILSTTTSTQDSGLLDVLVPMFEKKTGLTVKTISVGTGQALALAARGEADVTLAHAPGLEKRYVSDGKMSNRRLVMYNDFVIIGPVDDPAGIKGMASAVEALKKIAASQSRFVSRGDKSGTHTLELGLWKQAGNEAPRGAWYIESGQGMGATLGIANDRRAYTLTDRGTWLAFRKRVDLPVLVEKDRPLLNIYSVMEVNPANGPRVNAAGGRAFADFMVSPEVQGVIRTFGVDRFGQPLFVPVAGKREEDL